MSIDCTDPQQDLESLYDAIVGAEAPRHVCGRRIETRVRNVLGPLDRNLAKRALLPGYGGREVRVMRAAETSSGWVVVEGINLSSAARAAQDADALTSRMRRLREGDRARIASIIVGYTASPNGLNGESSIRDWIARDAQARLYDLAAEQDAFRAGVSEALDA